jgi:hypothetical protein
VHWYFYVQERPYTVKKRFAIFPSPAGMSLIKLSLDGNNLNIPAQGDFLVSDIPAGDGKIVILFLQCMPQLFLNLMVFKMFRKLLLQKMREEY